MSIRGKACIAGVDEHPTRHALDKSVAELHAEAAAAALAAAGIIKADVDGYVCAGDAPGLGGLSMIDYLGLKMRHVDSTETGGRSCIVHVAHAAESIAARGFCNRRAFMIGVLALTRIRGCLLPLVGCRVDPPYWPAR